MTARDLLLETVGLSEARITAENLHWVDVTARNYAIPPCAGGPTRLFESNLTLGNLDGQVNLDSSQIKNSVFGASETNLQLWDTNLRRVNFCAGTDHVVIAGQGSYECVACRELDGSKVPIDACLQADIRPLFLKSCRLLDVAPICDPAPIRMRRPFN